MTDYKQITEQIYPQEMEQASNAYLMSLVAVIAGLPLPILNVIASVFFYLGHRKSAYFIRWHCIQSILSQAVMIPFNSFAFGWTLTILFKNGSEVFEKVGPYHYHADHVTPADFFSSASVGYWLYIGIIVFLNVLEFVAVIATAAEVRKGKNIRWFLIANITDALTSTQNRDKFRI